LIFSVINDMMSKPVAIITGAGSGIGEAVAKHLYSKGYKIVVADMNSTTGEKVASALGSDAKFIQADVSSYHSQALLFKQAYEWGGKRLDFCHANAGIDDRQILYDAGEKEELDEDGLLKPLNTKTMQVNLEAIIQGLWLFKYYVRRSKEAGGGKGKFVATSSAAGL
jgi:15-hydroxyprostaglandin dehydrogenase (NAD)